MKTELLQQAAKKFGTPLYVYSESALKAPVLELQKGLKKIPHQICYAVKANGNLSLLKALGKMGVGADVVSEGELLRALNSGIHSDRIVFSGVGKTKFEIETGLKNNILSFNVESTEELYSIENAAKKIGKKAKIALRFNPDINPKTHPYISTGLKNNKFGLDKDEILDAIAILRKLKHLELHGISIHIGSQILSLDPLKSAFAEARELFHKIEHELGISMKFLDLGGGLGVGYKNSEKPVSIAKYCKIIEGLYLGPKKLRSDVRIILEPGRLIAAHAGTLITEVIYSKKRNHKNFIIVDAGMNDFMRTALYQAEHRITPLQKKKSKQSSFTVVGPVCESSDCFSEKTKLPVNTTSGDLLAIHDVGAYGASMASHYNARPKVAEVLITDKNKIKLIRKRENFEDLIKQEKECL